MLTVKQDQVREIDQNRFSVDASDLGMPAGHWPPMLSFSRESGEHMILHRNVYAKDRSNNLLYVQYERPGSTFELRIFND